MIKFSFSATPKKSSRKSISNKANIEILEKNIKGSVFIDIDSICYVIVNDVKYIIKKECYLCKNKERVFRLGCNTPKKICCDRVNAPKKELDNLYWIPFFAGSVVEGNIIINKSINVKYFDIKKYNIKEFNKTADNAYKFYKEHYQDINNNLIKRRLNVV